MPLVPENFGRPANIPAPQKLSRPNSIRQSRRYLPRRRTSPQNRQNRRLKSLSPSAPLPVVPEKKPEQPSEAIRAASGGRAGEETGAEEAGRAAKLPNLKTGATGAVRRESTAQFKGGVATSLVINGGQPGLRPALLPKIVDSQGREIYVGQVAIRTNAVEQGVAGYAKDVNAAANNFGLLITRPSSRACGLRERQGPIS